MAQLPSRYRPASFVLVLVSLLCMSAAAAQAAEGYYRWPTAHGDTVVFTAEGDLWRLDAGQTRAVRLTTHDELESEAHLSPDGERIAFNASFDGPTQIYVMPVSGGTPRQVTFESVGVEINQWAPDGRILYTSRNMEGTSRVRELRLVDPDSLAVERIPLRYVSTGTFDYDGETLFFTRHGVSTVSDNARLYRGGGMSQLWRYEMGSDEEAVRLAADFDGPIETPKFYEGRIYFISDASGYDNVWSLRPDGSDIRQHSRFAGWRLKDTSLDKDNGVLYYHRGADVYSYDIASNREQLIEIELASDSDRSRLRWIDNPLSYLSDAKLGGSGEEVAITARGRVTIARADEQRRVELPVGTTSRARAAVPGVNGEWIYAIVDAGERGEIWRFAADGSGSGEQLTNDADDHRWSLTPSPDGKWLIHDDKSSRLWKLNLETGAKTLIQRTVSTNDNPYGGFAFSTDGRYLAFNTAGNRDDSRIIMVHDLIDGDTVQITGDKYLSYDAAFSRDGQWLYFLSERHFQPTPGAPWGDRNMGAEFDKRVEIFAYPLTADAIFPFATPDELTPAMDDEDSEDEADASDAPAPMIDWQRASQRLFQVPVPPGNYIGLQAAADRLFVADRDGSVALKSVPITHDDPELTTFTNNIVDYQLSMDGSKVFFRGRGNSPTMAIVPVGEKAPDDLDDYRLRTSGWRLAIEPANEWQQLFLDAWRLHRDFAFDSDMRGVHWNEVRDRLLPLAARVAYRYDLNDLFGQMASEIGILHSQIRAGDSPEDEETASIASLGARFAPHADGMEIIQIYQGEADLPDSLGPLSQPDDDIQIGDVITAINNRPITNRADLNRALRNQIGQQTLLTTLRGTTTLQNVVTPVSLGSETMLRYLDWTQANAQKVADASDGEIGYLHLRAMGSSDVASFARDFFPLTELDGLIIDVRDNNGGNIDSFIIQQLLRKVWAFWEPEAGAPVFTNMQHTFRGHLAVLVNAGTYSDGETFAAGIKALDLGTLIGERTAGAGIWLSDRNELADGGMSRVAELPQFGVDGQWLIEGEGISPDIEVVAEPHALFMGEDQQLNAAVDYLQNRLASDPIPALRPQELPPMGQRGNDVE